MIPIWCSTSRCAARSAGLLMPELDLVWTSPHGDIIAGMQELRDAIDLVPMTEGAHMQVRIPKFPANVLQAARV